MREMRFINETEEMYNEELEDSIIDNSMNEESKSNMNFVLSKVKQDVIEKVIEGVEKPLIFKTEHGTSDNVNEESFIGYQIVSNARNSSFCLESALDAACKFNNLKKDEEIDNYTIHTIKGQINSTSHNNVSIIQDTIFSIVRQYIIDQLFNIFGMYNRYGLQLLFDPSIRLVISDKNFNAMEIRNLICNLINNGYFEYDSSTINQYTNEKIKEVKMDLFDQIMSQLVTAIYNNILIKIQEIINDTVVNRYTLIVEAFEKAGIQLAYKKTRNERMEVMNILYSVINKYVKDELILFISDFVRVTLKEYLLMSGYFIPSVIVHDYLVDDNKVIGDFNPPYVPF